MHYRSGGKLNHIYTYEDNEQVDIVRLTDIHFERGYLYFNLFSLKNRQLLFDMPNKGDKCIWKILDNREFDEECPGCGVSESEVESSNSAISSFHFRQFKNIILSSISFNGIDEPEIPLTDPIK